MEIISIDQIKNTPIIVEYLECVKVNPQLEVADYFYPTTPYGHFLYSIKGHAEYIYKQTVTTIVPGSLTYIPTEANPHFREDSDFEYIKIYFKIASQETSEEIILSDKVVKLLDKVPKNIKNEIFSLCYASSNKSISLFKLYSIFFSIFDEIQNERIETKENKPLFIQISPALLHIQNNYQYHFTTKELADMCNLSESYFRKQFREVIHSSPTEYRNYLRINYVCKELIKNERSVSYLCSLVGFENATHFYRTFKALVGTTPSEYRKRFSQFKNQS